MTEFFAHSFDCKGKHDRGPCACWQPLADHLRAVAEAAQRFAEEARPISIGDSPEKAAEKRSFHEAAYWAGLLHDVGKFRNEFQQMIRGLRPKSDSTRHKHIGATHAHDAQAYDVALAIAGHHGGLPDFDGGSAGLEVFKSLIQNDRDLWPRLRPVASLDCSELAGIVPATNKQLQTSMNSEDVNAILELRTRVLFGCLVDADWTDTARHQEIQRGEQPDPAPPMLDPMGDLKSVLEVIAGKAAACRDPQVADMRQQILDACLHAAELPTGLFAVSAPRGAARRSPRSPLP